MIQLRQLTISDSTIADNDLPLLSGLVNLEQLNLSRNGISDEGIEHLAGLKKLTNVRLNETFVTSDAEARLVARLPGVSRSLNGRVHERNSKETRIAPTKEALMAMEKLACARC